MTKEQCILLLWPSIEVSLDQTECQATFKYSVTKHPNVDRMKNGV